jgi:two-component system chemotaxis response regulator CheB
MEVDHCISLAEMGEVISGITETTPEEKPAPDDVIIESEIAEKVVVDYVNVSQLGEKSIYACPDCGGGLWNINKGGEGEGKVDRYRCHIGHSYSEKDLVIKQEEMFESTLWIALRIMEERRNLLMKMETDHTKKGFSQLAKNYKQKAADIQVHVDKMKEVLFASQKSV